MFGKNINSKGFTLIELLIATTIFSVVLLMCVYGLVGVGRSYSKGVNLSRTQSVARSVMDNISQALQYSSAEPYPMSGNILVSAGDSSKNFCIGDRWYEYQSDTKSEGLTGNYGFKVSKNCTSPTNTKVLLGKGMRINNLSITSNPDLSYSIKFRVATGDDDLFDANGNCTSGSGKQFCAISALETTVQRRLNTL